MELAQQSRSKLKAAQAGRELLLGTRTEQIARAEAEVRLAQAGMQRCRALREKYRLCAPHRGIVQLLVELNRELGVTILMVTHEHELAGKATRIVEFLDGMIVSDCRSGSVPREGPPAPPSATGREA